MHSINHSAREVGGRAGYITWSRVSDLNAKWNASEYFGCSIILGPEGSSSFIHWRSSMVLSIIAFVRFRTRFWLKCSKAFISLQKDKTLLTERSDYVSRKKTIQWACWNINDVKRMKYYGFVDFYIHFEILFRVKKRALVKIFQNLYRDEKWVKCLTFWCRNFYIQYYYLILQKTVFSQHFSFIRSKEKIKKKHLYYKYSNPLFLAFFIFFNVGHR